MQSDKNIRRKKQKRAHLPLPHRLHEALDIPLEGFPGISRAEIIGKHEASVYGCECVLVYTAESILVRVKKGYIRIVGKDLEMQSLIGDCITVHGEIRSLSLSDRETTEEKA